MRRFEFVHNGSAFYFFSGVFAGFIPLSIKAEMSATIPLLVGIMVFCYRYAEIQRNR